MVTFKLSSKSVVGQGSMAWQKVMARVQQMQIQIPVWWVTSCVHTASFLACPSCLSLFWTREWCFFTLVCCGSATRFDALNAEFDSYRFACDERKDLHADVYFLCAHWRLFIHMLRVQPVFLPWGPWAGPRLRTLFLSVTFSEGRGQSV